MFLLSVTIKKMKANTANMLTLSNMGLGGFSILFTSRGEFGLAIIFIFLAALSDRLDGAVARRMNIESELGRQLDSMADIVSFIVAPALLTYQNIFQGSASVPVMFFTVFYIACGAFRLARFNVTESDGYFTGVPSTAAGVLLTLCQLLSDKVSTPFFLSLLLFLSFAMVSPFKLRKM